MILCDECQKRMVAVLDGEATKEEEKSVSEHLANCADCRKCHDEIIDNKQMFSIAAALKASVPIGQDFMQTVGADVLRSDSLSGGKLAEGRTRSWYRLPPLAWAGGLVAALLVVVSWLACYALTKEVADLKDQLQAANKLLTVADAEKLFRETQESQKTAIAILYYEMEQLREQVEYSPSPRTAFLPAELNGFPGRSDDL